MCGIAGIFSANNFSANLHIRRMADALRHRGPDDEGYLAVDIKEGEVHHLTGDDSKIDGRNINSLNSPANLFLAHRRLSIIDPSPAGHQPMSNAGGSLWIVYNGEIYNYVELREELKALGYDFKTNTDTEVLLAAYEEWGTDCLSRFNGMWSFVIYDRRKNILFGARDRFGVKPFYYYLDKMFFVFASEIKAFHKLPFIRTGINAQAVFDYLVLGYQEMEEEGFFRNIIELQPSFAFRFDLAANTFQKWKYYSLIYSDDWEKFDLSKLDKHLEAIRGLLFNAVKFRLRSDVRVGSCLSGGIDSSTIVCAINEILETECIAQIGDRQKVFTASYDNEAIDESGWANIVVAQTKTSWHRTFPKSGELLDDLDDLVYSQDIPFSSTSIYAQYRVMKLAEESGVKVLLDGQGGDELFTGYHGYHGAFAAEMLKHFDIGGFIREWKGVENSPLSRKTLLMSLLNNIRPRVSPPALKKAVLKTVIKENNYISPDFWNEYSGRLNKRSDSGRKSLNRMLYEFMTRLNLKNLLRYEDRNSMRFSVESRTPFADDISLIEYVFKVPSVYKIHNGWSKYLLREASTGLIPEKIRARSDKIGFATPEYYWLNEIKHNLKNYISNDLKIYFNVEKLLNDWEKLMSNQSKRGNTHIWRFINLAVWKKVYSL